MKVSIYDRNIKVSPSGYYRLLQYFEKIECDKYYYNLVPKWMFNFNLKLNKNKKIYWIWAIFYYFILCARTVCFFLMDIVRKPDYLVFSQTIIPRKCPSFLLSIMEQVFKKTKVIWDCDDYIMGAAMPYNEMELVLKYAYKIIVTHEFLKEAIPCEYSEKVILMPTTDGDMQGYNFDAVKRNRMSSYNDEINIIWLATAGNMPNLKIALKGLELAAKRLKVFQKKLRLKVVCNMPCEEETADLIIENIPWSREVGIEQILKAHIGIMPLINSEFSKGKGAFKLIQYMSTGLPVIASAVGFNCTVVDSRFGYLISNDNNAEEWAEAIVSLAIDREKWHEYSDESYKVWNTKYSFEDNLDLWKQILENR